MMSFRLVVFPILALVLLVMPAAAREVTTEKVYEPVFGGMVLIVEAGPKQDESVVLVHGLGDAGSQDWRAQIEALAEHYHVVSFDLPGFGRSEKRNTRYTPLLYAVFVKWVVDRYVDGDFTLVGHSMGGAIALRFAATFPRRLERLILIDVAGVLHRASFSKFHAVHKIEDVLDDHPRSQRWLSKLTGSLMHRAEPPFDPATILGSPGLRKRLLGGEPSRIAALALVGEDFSRLAEEVAVPTLLIWGEDDDVAPLRIGQLLRARIPDATLEVLPGVGHTPMTEQPEMINQLLAAALAGAPADPTEPDPAPPVSTLLTSLADPGLGPGQSLTASAPAASAAEPEPVGTGERIGQCREQTGVVFTGSYRRIEIDQCTGVRLVEVEAEEVTIVSSRVELLDCRLTGSIPLVIRSSAVTATNLVVSGETALLVDESYLDLAGADLRGSRASIESSGKSFFIFSLSSLHSPIRSGRVHEVIKLKQDELL